MQALTESLTNREAIPKIRRDLFCNSDLAEVGARSPQQTFESNGTHCEAILRHAHFAPYLRYFIEGPDLPAAAIEGLCEIMNDDTGTSGMLRQQCQKHVRSCVRDFGLNRRRASTEFYRLGIEIGMEPGSAEALRTAARTTP